MKMQLIIRNSLGVNMGNVRSGREERHKVWSNLVVLFHAYGIELKYRLKTLFQKYFQSKLHWNGG